jgi:hypothetical protein
VNPEYTERLEAAGMKFVGRNALDSGEHVATFPFSLVACVCVALFATQNPFRGGSFLTCIGKEKY